MASIDKYTSKSGAVSYRARVRRNGSPPLTQTFTKLSDAQRWAATHEGLALARVGDNIASTDAILDDLHATEGTPQHLIVDVFQRYHNEILPQKRVSTARSQRYQLGKLQRLLGAETPLNDVTPRVIRGLCDRLKASGVEPATIVRYLALLSHIFTTAIRDWEILTANPCQLIKRPREPRGRTRYLSHEELDCLLTACQASRNRHLYLLVLLAVSTGARQGELVNLRWADIDTIKGVITICESKNGSQRCVPVTGRALEQLRTQTPVDPGAFVFPHRIAAQQPYRKAWETVIRHTGLQDVTFHTLRHTAASHLMMSGASLLDAATVLGHHSLSMVQRYAHLSVDHLTGVLERMTHTMLGERHRNAHKAHCGF